MQLLRTNKIFFQIAKFLLIFFFINSFYSSTLFSKEIKIIANENNIEKLLKLDPNNVDFLFIYAKKKEELNEYQSAENIYKK